jgi:N-acetylneuraminic acid mutarotase
MLVDVLLRKLEEDLRGDLERTVTGFVATTRTQLENALADVDRERASGLAEVAKERADLQREMLAMQKQQEAQQGRIVLDVGGYRYTTSVETLRRIPGTFFDAYFSGRYAMDRSEDGSIFIDRDGEHFGQVLEYLRDGKVPAVDRDAAELDVGMLRWLKREFGFYSVDVFAEPQEVAFAVGGVDNNNKELSSVERYDAASGEWREAAEMTTARYSFGLCALGGDLYVTGGWGAGDVSLASVERYDPGLDTWSGAPAMPRARRSHCACSVGNAMYVLGGIEEINEEYRTVSSVLKYDSRKQTWKEVASMPAERDYAGACVVGSDIYIFGGRDDDTNATSTTYRFSTETNEWVTLAPMPEARKRFHRVCMLDGLIYVLGGQDKDRTILTSVHRFDPSANSWTVVAPMSVRRAGLGAFVLGGNIYAAGGWDGASRLEQLLPLSYLPNYLWGQSKPSCNIFLTWNTANARLASVERYSVALDTWSEVSDGEFGPARNGLHAHTMRVEVNLFDSLLAEAKRARM